MRFSEVCGRRLCKVGAPAESLERGSGVFWGLWTEVVGEFPAGLNLSDGIKNKLCKGFDLINSSVLFILSTYANAGFQVLHRWFFELPIIYDPLIAI